MSTWSECWNIIMCNVNQGQIEAGWMMLEIKSSITTLGMTIQAIESKWMWLKHTTDKVQVQLKKYKKMLTIWFSNFIKMCEMRMSLNRWILWLFLLTEHFENISRTTLEALGNF